jgi:hypothetical protein
MRALRIASASIDSFAGASRSEKSPMAEPNASVSIDIRSGRRMLLAVFALLTLASGAQAATVFSREQDIGALRLGQRARVDDGTCPAGQIKEVSGARMTENGVFPARKCVPRVGPKTK